MRSSPSHVASEPLGRGQVKIRVKDAVTALDRSVAFFDCRIEMTKTEFSISQEIAPLAHSRITRTEAHRLLNIRFGFLELAQMRFDVASCCVEKSVIWIDDEAGVDDTTGVV